MTATGTYVLAEDTDAELTIDGQATGRTYAAGAHTAGDDVDARLLAMLAEAGLASLAPPATPAESDNELVPTKKANLQAALAELELDTTGTVAVLTARLTEALADAGDAADQDPVDTETTDTTTDPATQE